MATKKTIKSSKTAHVLNVLSGSPDITAVEEPLASTPAARPLTPPILEDARATDQALVGAIHDALAQELEEEDVPMETQQLIEQADVPAPVIEPEPQPAPVEAPTPSPEVASPVSAQPSDPLSASTVELPGDLVYVNIMQALVEEKAPKYMEMFGLCTCSRCIADVKAVALSNLPPKYLVMPKGEFIPMLTVYERQYLTSLTAQIISACKKVMELPRH